MEVKRLPQPQDPRNHLSHPMCQQDIDFQNTIQEVNRKRAFQQKFGAFSRIERHNQCTQKAVVLVNNKPMCRRHAGHLALDYLLNQT